MGRKLSHFYSLVLALSTLVISQSVCKGDETWPIPPLKYPKRPTPDSFCQASMIPFCPTGLPPNTMPKFDANDTLYVYAMKAPVWEAQVGSLLAKFDIMHDAIGFHHVQTGLNLTVEWYELFQLFNCTFPHELTDNDKPQLLWCNQGATCAYPGIDEKHWRQNGTLVKVSEISGDIFNKFGDWVDQDNTTFPIYETWTVMDKPDGNLLFNPTDSTSWVLRAYDAIKNLGGQFNDNVHLNYTKITLYSKTPKRLGSYAEIFDSNEPAMNRTKDYLLNFYKHFQKESNNLELIIHLLEGILDFLIDDSFFLYYDNVYWQLPLVQPYINLTYKEIPLP